AGVLVHLDEAALVEEELDALAGGLLAAGVLLLDGAIRTGVGDLGHATLEVGELAGRRVDVDVSGNVCAADRLGIGGLGALGHGAQPILGLVPEPINVQRLTALLPPEGGWGEVVHLPEVGSTNTEAAGRDTP